MAGRTIFILGNIKIFGIENTAEIGNVVETFNVPFKSQRMVRISMFRRFDGNGFCVSGLMDK